MKWHDTPIAGAYVIELEPAVDERGFFARTYDAAEFETRGVDPRIAQCSISFNARQGTLRGLHYQTAPHEETKLVRCSRGAIFDVIVDLATGRWFGVQLTADIPLMLYVPRGVAHGFQTLIDDTEVVYQISVPHHPDSARGIRWNDPELGIPWPFGEPILSDADRNRPLWKERPDA